MAQVIGYAGGFGVGDTTDRTVFATTTPLPLGTVGQDAAGNEYRYVRAAAAIAANTALMPTSSATPFDQVAVTSGADLPCIGVNQTAFTAANQCGWILRRGVASVVTAGTVAVTTPQTTAAAGAFANAAAANVNNAVGFILLNTASPQTCYVDAL